MIIEAAAGAIACGAGVLAYGVRSPRSSLIAPSVYRGPRNRASIALTFDDGPSESTPRVLELLREYGAKATFFQCGANVRRVSALARAVGEAGCEIGNHTENHVFLHLRSQEFIRAEVASAQQTIADATGRTPKVFRAPYGVRWFGLGRVQEELGLTGVMWSVIGLDWKLDARSATERLLKGVRPGSIVCLHDGRELKRNPDISVTLETLRRVLPQWKDRGLQFETVSELLCPTN